MLLFTVDQPTQQAWLGHPGYRAPAGGPVASGGVTTSSEAPGADDFWRRPVAPPEAEAPPSADRADTPTNAGPAATPPYPGPPVAPPPPPEWRPPVRIQLPPPRSLPPQDHEALDAAERSARTFTYGVGMIAGAVLVVLTCLLCSRIMF